MWWWTLQKPASAVYGKSVLPEIERKLEELREEGRKELERQGFSKEDMDDQVYLNLRYQGTDTAMMVARPADRDYAGALSDRLSFASSGSTWRDGTF